MNNIKERVFLTLFLLIIFLFCLHQLWLLSRALPNPLTILFLFIFGVSAVMLLIGVVQSMRGRLY